MLTLIDRKTRREFLRAGGLTLGGLSLLDLLAGGSQAASGLMRDKSVIFLFLQGGPSQFETFDPKMDAPAGNRSTTGEVSTTIPGVTFGSTFQRLAQLAHKFSVVRSFTTGDGNHDIKPIVGKDTAGANLGSIFTRVAGTNHPRTGMPRNIALFPRAIDPQAKAPEMGFGKFDATGTVGSAYAPFMLGGDGNFQRDLVLKISGERLTERRTLLGELDRLRRQADSPTGFGSLDQMQAQAFDTILGGAATAFDLDREDPRTIARYDTSGLIRADRISTKWNNHKQYADHVATLGKLLLYARRLCEAGAGFVTVTTGFVWDMHADVNNAPCSEGMRYCGLPLDHALSAFIEDVESRGLRDKIMLVACGEMGRTPGVNSGGGRDHWGGLAPLLIYGGGLQMGKVIGHSSRNGAQPASEPVTTGNLIATILNTLLDVGQVRIERGLPADVVRAATAYDPIAGLI